MPQQLLHFIPNPVFALAQVNRLGATLARAEQAHEVGQISDERLVQIRMAYEAALISLELSKPLPN